MVNEHSFLKLVKKKGGYGSEGEASRAVNSVFGSIKALLSPAASDVIRTILPPEASLLWRFSPASIPASAWQLQPSATDRSRHFLLRIQQLGEYRTLSDASRAANSVILAMGRSLPPDSGRFLRRMFPPEIVAAAVNYPDRAA